MWELPLVGRAKPPATDWLSGEHVTQAGQSALPESALGRGSQPRGGREGTRSCQVEMRRGGEGAGRLSRLTRGAREAGSGLTLGGPSSVTYWHLPSLSFCIWKAEAIIAARLPCPRPQ